MNDKFVTAKQAGCIRKIANDKGVDCARFQTALDNGSFARFIDGLVKPAVKAPEGAQLHTFHVRVKLDCGRREVFIEEDIVLLNFTDGGWSLEKILAWAQSVGLKTTVIDEVVALTDQHRKLNSRLGQDSVYVVTTTPFSFAGIRRDCGVLCLDDSICQVHMDTNGDYDGAEDRKWFAFRI